MARKDARQALAALLDTNATLQAVYAHEVKDFKRISPVAMVHSDGIQPYLHRDGFGYALIVSLWWKRSSDGADTEDAMDDLSEQIVDLLLESTTGELSGLVIDEEFTRMDYPVVDGVMYRRERIRVIV